MCMQVMSAAAMAASGIHVVGMSPIRDRGASCLETLWPHWVLEAGGSSTPDFQIGLLHLAEKGKAAWPRQER